jgi:hypothetical protein
VRDVNAACTMRARSSAHTNANARNRMRRRAGGGAGRSVRFDGTRRQSSFTYHAWVAFFCRVGTLAFHVAFHVTFHVTFNVTCSVKHQWIILKLGKSLLEFPVNYASNFGTQRTSK